MNIFEHQQLVKSIALKVADPEFRARRSYSRPVFVAHGPAGSGKTHNTTLAGTEIHFPVINIRLGQELAADMRFPKVKDGVLIKILAEMWLDYKKDENGEKIPRRRVNENGEIVEIPDQYQIRFESLKHYISNYKEVAAYYEEMGLTIDDAPGGIMFLDEINRIEDKQMFQMIFQLFESGTFKGHTIPAELTLMGACNPPGDGYIVQNWFDDPAFANRCVHYKLLPEEEISIEIARSAGYSDIAVELVSTYPELLFNKEENDFELPAPTYSLRNLSFFENYVMNIDWKETDYPQLETYLITAIYGAESVARFQTIVEESAQRAIPPVQLLTKYDAYDVGPNAFKIEEVDGVEKMIPDTVFDNLLDRDASKAKSKERGLILQAGIDNKSDYLLRVSTTLLEYIVDNIEDPKFQQLFADNKLRFLQFALDLPRDTYASMMATLLREETFKGKKKKFFDIIGLNQNDVPSKTLVESVLKLDQLIVKSVNEK